jgi:alkylation response protein AidB-like acyl-CoA dehydrogenase
VAGAGELDRVEGDPPMFEAGAFRLTEQQVELTALARRLGAEKFAPRAAEHDRDASFPTANYRDLRASGLLAICVPRSMGGSAPTTRPTC